MHTLLFLSDDTINVAHTHQWVSKLTLKLALEEHMSPLADQETSRLVEELRKNDYLDHPCFPLL